MAVLESFSEGVSDVLTAEVGGINVAYGLGAAAVVLGGIYLLRKGYQAAIGKQ